MLIGYTTVGTSNLQRAMSFYDALFDQSGFVRLMEMPGVATWGTSWRETMFSVVVPRDGQPASAGNGALVAFGVEDRAKVRMLHARAVALGGKDCGAPKVLGPEGAQAFYAGYVSDLDGNKIGFHSIGPEAAS